MRHSKKTKFAKSLKQSLRDKTKNQLMPKWVKELEKMKVSAICRCIDTIFASPEAMERAEEIQKIQGKVTLEKIERAVSQSVCKQIDVLQRAQKAKKRLDEIGEPINIALPVTENTGANEVIMSRNAGDFRKMYEAYDQLKTDTLALEANAPYKALLPPKTQK